MYIPLELMRLACRYNLAPSAHYRKAYAVRLAIPCGGQEYHAQLININF